MLFKEINPRFQNFQFMALPVCNIKGNRLKDMIPIPQFFSQIQVFPKHFTSLRRNGMNQDCCHLTGIKTINYKLFPEFRIICGIRNLYIVYSMFVDSPDKVI